jgi:hypothetical protein
MKTPYRAILPQLLAERNGRLGQQLREKKRLSF